MLKVDPEHKDAKEAVALAEAFRHGHQGRVPIPLRPAWWLPDDRDRVFRYEGSLTTPPYSETVSWVVFREPKVISPGLFEAIFGDHPQEARAIQPLNRGYVLDLTGLKVTVAK